MGQRSFLILGILGLLPFIVIFCAYFIAPPDKNIYELLLYLFIAYSAIIASFLGGIQWGMIISKGDQLFSIALPITLSVIPSLISWCALLILNSLILSLCLIILAYLFATLTDFYLYNKKVTPYWFLNMRVPLSLIVVILAFVLLTRQLN